MGGRIRDGVPDPDLADGTNWTTIYSTTTGTGGTQTLNVTGTGRYVRMYGTARATAVRLLAVGVPGLRLPGAAGGACGTTDAALEPAGHRVLDRERRLPASAAVDGNTGTRWSSAFSDPQWLQVDLGSSQTICQVTLNWEAAYAKAFQIQTSPDGTTWTTIYSTTTGTGGIQTLTVTGTGRYVRMYGTARATQYGYSLWEFGVYTTGSGGGTGNTVTVTNPGSQTSTVGTAVSLQITATDSASGQTLTYSATGLPAGLSISSSSGLISGHPHHRGHLHHHRHRHRHHRRLRVGLVHLDRDHRRRRRLCPAQSNTPNFGPNVDIFDPSMSSASIQSTLDSVFNTQKLNQFGTQRDALLFKPGTYSAEANIGYYTSIQGLGQNPDDVTINGDVTVDAFDGTGNATQNFWRSAENMAINPSAGSDRWAVAQAGPFRRMDVHGGLELYPASYGYASGGYIADTKVSGQVFLGVAAAVVLAGQQLRQLERLGLEHGVLGRERRPGAELPEPADDHAGHHPGVPGRAVPLHRLER